MTDTNQKLREALQAYQDANEMSPYGDYSKIEWESSAGPVNPSWGGGDCKKHGRWYGRCYSCSDEWDNLRKSADRDAYTARENALNAAKQRARQALALPTAAPVGEREAFEDLIEEFEAAAIDKHDCRNPEYEFEYRAYDSACQRYDEARSALSAGDAVDGPLIDEGSTTEPSLHPVAHIELGDDFEDVVTVEQAQAYATAAVQQYKADAHRYRWLMDNCTLGIKQNGVGWSLNTTACIAPDCIKDVGATIDAAMRKGQL